MIPKVLRCQYWLINITTKPLTSTISPKKMYLRDSRKLLTNTSSSLRRNKYRITFYYWLNNKSILKNQRGNEHTENNHLDPNKWHNAPNHNQKHKQTNLNKELTLEFILKIKRISNFITQRA